MGSPADSLLAGSSAELDCATSATELLEIDSLLLLDSSTTLGMTFWELLEGTAAELNGFSTAELAGVASPELTCATSAELSRTPLTELDSGALLSVPAGLSDEHAKKLALANRSAKK